MRTLRNSIIFLSVSVPIGDDLSVFLLFSDTFLTCVIDLSLQHVGVSCRGFTPLSQSPACPVNRIYPNPSTIRGHGARIARISCRNRFQK
jgi:hypothetical protein